MILQQIPFEVIALIYFFMGPYTQSQFGKTCRKFHEALKISDEFFENSGVLKTWHTYQIWNMEDTESQLKGELAHLLLEQRSVRLYARYLMDGVQPNFNPFECLHLSFMMLLKSFANPQAVLNMTNIDPEVLALLVRMYPNEMLSDSWYGAESSITAYECDELLLNTYCLKKRAKWLLKAVFTAHPISLKYLIVSCSSNRLKDYLGNGLICTLLKHSQTNIFWQVDFLDEFSCFLTSPKAMQLFFKVTEDNNLVISYDFLEKSLKFGVPVPEIQRCAHHYCAYNGERMSETFKQVLLHFGTEHESFVMDCMCQFAQDAKVFNWTEDDDLSTLSQGYSDAFRVRMKELQDESSQNYTLRIAFFLS